jgi:histidinol dehydrogenase
VLIRRLSVPPLEALEPYLPRVAGPDPETRRIVAGILDDVAANGDAAVRAYTLQFDGVDLPGRARWVESTHQYETR